VSCFSDLFSDLGPATGLDRGGDGFGLGFAGSAEKKTGKRLPFLDKSL